MTLAPQATNGKSNQVTVNDRWYQPKSGPQKQALDNTADILLMGGAAGSLKTATLLMDACQENKHRDMRAVVFRKTYPELDEIIEQSREMYSQMGAVYNDSKHTWRFPAGGFVKFRYIERDKQKYKYQGMQFSMLGFDESTHQPEGIIRYLMTRNRSTNPNLKIRVRLASNPGNEGHKWHKDLFLHGVCPHCHPGQGAVPGKLYYDRVWPSDKVPLSDPDLGKDGMISTAFIPGHLSDHQLLGPRYQQLLKTQNPVTAKALLAGCWEQFEGQFFTIWEPSRGRTAQPGRAHPDPTMAMVQDVKEIGYKWWWPHWVSCDYGFAGSVASASLFCRRPPYSEAMPNGRTREWKHGRVYKLSEMVSARRNAVDFAGDIVRKWILDSEGRRIDRRFHAFYLSPDVGKDIGLLGADNIHTIKGQMNKVLEPYGFAFQNAATDRIGGAMKLYVMLQTGELVICTRCKQTIEMFPTRIHDVDHENDVLKVKGDELDDVYDDTRYGVYSPNFEEKRPTSERVMEVFDEGLTPTNTMIRVKQVQAEIAEEESPVVFGGKALRDRLARNSAKGGYRRPID